MHKMKKINENWHAGCSMLWGT